MVENIENFLYLLLTLAAVGGILGMIFGVIASFVSIGFKLAPWVVITVMIILYFQM